MAGALWGCDEPPPNVVVPLDLSVAAVREPVVPPRTPAPEGTAPTATPTVAPAAPPATPTAPPTPSVTAAPSAPAATGKTPVLFIRAGRCGECHEHFRKEWNASAHVKATRSAAFQRSLVAASDSPGGGGLREACQTCHLPSLHYGQPDEAPGNPSEGVSCDGCHTLSAVKVEPRGATMTFDPGSGKKYGPIVGATGHYFHDMAYSALHAKSEVCAGCHHMTALAAGGKLREVPVVLDYSDWLRVGKGKPCQDCHMPSRGTEPVARGAKPRPNVPSHGFPGAVALGKATRLEAALRGRPGEVAVTIQHGAGHMLPSGYVDRRLLLRAEYQGPDGSKLATEERAFGVFLVDEAGQPAPFFRAVRVKEERRIAPGRPHTETFVLPQPGVAGAVSVAAAPARVVFSLVSAPTAPELRAVYGEPELAVIKSVTLNLPQRPGGKL
ncbi:MAG: multiheme c-type cytochrome [Polyangia bacterium]